MVALPLFKLGALAIRQVTKPLVASVVRYSAEHMRFRAVCIKLGRISYGLSGAYEEAAKTEEAAAKTDDGAPSEVTTEQVAAAAAASPSSTSSSMTRNAFFFRPIESAKQAYARRFRANIPEKLLIDAGAFVVVELAVYLIAAFLLWLEYRSSAAAQREKERVLNERIDELERKVNELAQHQKLGVLRPLTKRESWGNWVSSSLFSSPRPTSDLLAGPADQSAAPAAAAPVSVAVVVEAKRGESHPPSPTASK